MQNIWGRTHAHATVANSHISHSLVWATYGAAVCGFKGRLPLDRSRCKPHKTEQKQDACNTDDVLVSSVMCDSVWTASSFESPDIQQRKEQTVVAHWSLTYAWSNWEKPINMCLSPSTAHRLTLPPAHCRYVPRTAANGHAVPCDPGTYFSNIGPIQIKCGLKILNLDIRQWRLIC